MLMSAPDTVTRTEPGFPSIAEPSRLVTERDEPANDDATSVLSDDWSAMMSKRGKTPSPVSYVRLVPSTGSEKSTRNVSEEASVTPSVAELPMSPERRGRGPEPG